MDVFFYGLFMDEEILMKNGVAPSNPRKGYLNNYTLKIGNRASLIPADGEKAYGILMQVDDVKIKNLYAEKSVADYVPENVEIMTESNELVSATCYNLPLELLAGTNQNYAKLLYDLAKRLNLPSSYLEKIEAFTF